MLDRIGVAVTIVDIDPRAFRIARLHFHLPARVQTHAADGVRFLRCDTAKYDAIVVDAFVGHTIPAPFLRPAFLACVKARLKRGGIFLLNTTVDDDGDRTPDRLARRLAKIWSTVRLLDSDGWIDRNAVLAAGAVRGLMPPKLRLRPAREAAKLERHIAALEFRKLR
jgi:SAM-dependent methyltransferase